MRIAIVSDTYAPAVNGVATFTATLAQLLAGQGHRVAVLAPSYPGTPLETQADGVQVVRFQSVGLPGYSPARLCLTPEAGSRVRTFLEDFRPDIVHLQTHFFLAQHALRASQELGLGTLATCHSNPENFILNMPILLHINSLFHPWYWKHAMAFYRQTHLVTVPVGPMAQVLRRHGYSGPIEVVPNGVHTDLFAPEAGEQDAEVRAKYGIPCGKSMLFVGRLDEDKGVTGLIELLQRFAVDGESTLIVCGSGNREGYLRQRVQELGLGHHVIFTGAISAHELASIYRMATSLIMVGRNEIQPISALEALASGLPVICLRTENLEATIQDGVNGYLAASVEHIHELANRLLADEDLTARLGAAARQCAESRFSVERSASEFVNCYESVLRRHER